MNQAGRDRADVLISVVLPVYNEAAILPQLAEALEKELSASGCRYELIFVNDGSRDGSAAALDELARTRQGIKIVHFARNFGHQSALHAGLDHGVGDVFIVMDSDMQDLPSAIPVFMQKWREGFDVVYAIRTKRKENWFKVFLFHSFYRLLNKLSVVYIPNDAGNFSLLDGKVARLIADFKECDRFFPGLRSWVGFRQVGVEVERGARYDDEPRVSMLGLFALARTAIFSFSALPLLMFYVISGIAMVVFLGVAVYSLVMKLFVHIAVPGWTSMVMIGSIFGALNSLGVAILGEYISRIYNQVRARPSYVVSHVVVSAPDSKSAGRLSQLSDKASEAT